MADVGPEAALGEIARHLTRLQRPFALVGGLAVSVRAEVRFTRDVDIAVTATGDADVVAMKVLSMSERRLQDKLDAVNLLLVNDDLDLQSARESLERIRERGFDRGQDLPGKLDALLREVASG